MDVIETALAEIRQLVAQGPCFRLVSRSSDCPVQWILLVYRTQEYPLKLSRSGVAVFNCVAQNRLPQNARQIADSIKRTRRIGVRSVKTYIQRIRRALQLTFAEARLNLDPSAVLSSDRTESNEVQYRLKAQIKWCQLEQPGEKVI